MSRPTHYARKAKSPCPDSRYAFHLAANRILDSEPTPPLGTAPSEITDDMSAAEARYWRRHNPVLELLQEAAIKTIKARLLAIGVPAEALRDPMGPAAQALVNGMLHGERCLLQIHRENCGIGWISKPLVEHHVSILCPTSAPVGQNEGLPERRMAGSS
ncbi:hypothetical protein [Methylobacterium sp. Leaf125]|uniref:hypothetical protein n=1 Tax=Methylobacterium sp. Leaf125 TaxID=1736265 RepID=UPI000A465B2C|nr:hypothetical protein [Methylobacterium sp. Leaf125]